MSLQTQKRETASVPDAIEFSEVLLIQEDVEEKERAPRTENQVLLSFMQQRADELYTHIFS